MHSLPRLIRPCRGNREVCFANKPALQCAHGTCQCRLVWFLSHLFVPCWYSAHTDKDPLVCRCSVSLSVNSTLQRWAYRTSIHLLSWWISPYIRSFHSKALLWKGVLPQYWMLIFPLYPRNPISCDEVWATLGCAGREVGVGLVRVRMTFLWMSDTTSCYFSFEALLLIFCLFQLNVRL